MIRYKLYQGNNSRTGTKGLWYARAVVEDTVDLEALSEHMANHNTPYSAGAIKGVLTDMINCIKELILDGKSVKLPDLAYFKAGISSAGASTRKEFSVQKNIRAVRLRTHATGKLRTSEMKSEIVVKEYSAYDKNTTTNP